MRSIIKNGRIILPENIVEGKTLVILELFVVQLFFNLKNHIAKDL